MKRILALLMLVGVVGCGTKGLTGPNGEPIKVYKGEDEYGNKIEYQFYQGGMGQVKHGYYRVFDGGGNIYIEGEYIESEKWNGTFAEYYENGGLREKVKYRFGSSHGKSVWYYENGEIEVERSYRSGKKHGKWVYYYGNGQLEMERVYRAGGKIREVKYYENGLIEVERNYKIGLFGGEKHGRWVYYYDNGQLEMERIYNSGLRDDMEVRYDRAGNIIDEDIYKDGDCVDMCEGDE